TGVGPATGEERFQLGRHRPPGQVGGDEGVECPVYNLAEYIVGKGRRPPTLSKMDIEGEEARVVPSILEYVVASKAQLLISTHSEEITRSLADLLARRGLRIAPLQWATRPTARTVETATLILASS